MPDISLWWRELPGTTQALTDGVRNVWFDVRARQVERRCSSRHEQEHILAGHTGCVSGTQEDRVRFRAAQWLCPNPRHVAEALIGAGGDVHDAADHLWLDVPTMQARLDWRFMHPAERALIDRLVDNEHLP
jgi:hypothetical protein